MTAGQPRLFATPQEQLTSDDYYTPAWVFERMGITFDLDVCAPPGGISWIPAARYFTQADDGLTAEWSGRVWMNPPWSHSGPWIERFISHANGVCLVPVAKSYAFEHLWSVASGVVLHERRAKFVYRGQNGISTAFQAVVAAFGDDCVEAISRLGVVRRIA